ncbi:hypothetical protein LGN06_25905 [Burkholderia vietnamiensis]|uniref:hypothetical protein n=1 Tax=Burkholderia vietnamiensis TaxID=60552 RepID=UPI001CF43F66|nr:hypothetical protein [Burkholderia vietnamiensis]MCA8394997.1 hypothetical protein [Burkholderia vietnamiensis]
MIAYVLLCSGVIAWNQRRTMLIREQGRFIKLLRVEPPKRPSIRARARECVIGTFRADEPVPTGLLDTLSRDERKLLERWLAAYRETKARDQVRPVLASASEQFERLVGALEVAADTLSSAEADQIWAQLHAIARTLKKAGHPRPRAARRPPAPLPGQQVLW